MLVSHEKKIKSSVWSSWNLKSRCFTQPLNAEKLFRIHVEIKCGGWKIIVLFIESSDLLKLIKSVGVSDEKQNICQSLSTVQLIFR